MVDFSTERTYAQFQQDFPRWAVTFHDVVDLFRRQPSYAVAQVYCVLGALVCLAHAFYRDGRWPFLWLAGVVCGIVIEGSLYFSPYGETIWHSPTALDLFGQRVPLFVFFAYPFFYYQAFWAVSKLQLKCRWSEHIAAGLLVVLFDLPFDMVGIKFLHWTLHDTEPMFADRLYSAPWTLLLFFAVCTFTFSYAFRHLRRLFGRPPPAGSASEPFAVTGTIVQELGASVVTGMLAVPLGSALFLAISYPLHTLLGIPQKPLIVAVFLCVLTVYWKFDRKSNRRLPLMQGPLDHLLNLFVVGQFWLYLFVAALLDPEQAVSTGRHQLVGQCDDTNQRGFLCAQNASAKSDFDFHCLVNRPTEGAYWYTVCGKPFENRDEFLFALTVIAMLGSLIHWTLHYDYDIRFKIYEFVKKDRLLTKKAS